MTNSTNYLNHATVVQANWLNDVDRWLYDDVINIMNYGADNTGGELCNTVLDLAKAAGKTVYFPPGTYKIENYTLQDLRIVGARSSGANFGANEQTVIEGSGDIFVGANNFALEHMVIRNSSAGTRGKLLTVANIDTKVGPIIDVDFRKSTHHIYAGDATKAIVSGQLENCRFSDASVYSRYFLHNLYAYDEYNNYTTSNQRGLYMRSCSTANFHGAATVFEYNSEGAVYVENLVEATDAIRSLRFQGIHFEGNGAGTPSSDVTINIVNGLGRIAFADCGFYLPTVAATNVIDLSSSPLLKISHQNCTDIGFVNLASTSVISSMSPKVSGQTLSFYGQNGSLMTDEQMIAGDGFHSQSQLSATITGSASDILPMPAAGAARLVLVCDSTTEGAALLMLTNGVVTTVNTALTSVTFSTSGGFLRAATSGGASSRVLYMTYLNT